MDRSKNNLTPSLSKSVRKVTYEVRGMTESVFLLSMGNARVRVHFRGGAISGFGNVPATFTTSSGPLQDAIERSPQFRAGIITRRVALR
ncbi:MAG: hypothetical protein K2M87_04705 [Muribaculaceae bacterium]|nr:hypothetical protein [Muribaculaceae bacterium]